MNDVHAWDEPGAEQRSEEHERYHVQCPLDHRSTMIRIQRHANDWNAVDSLPLPESDSVAWIQSSRRPVRESCQDGDVMAKALQSFSQVRKDFLGFRGIRLS